MKLTAQCIDTFKSENMLLWDDNYYKERPLTSPKRIHCECQKYRILDLLLAKSQFSVMDV